ncbi:MAG: D-glycero-beta-D-manno-heptose 1-phosphate adenylyltransferase [Bacteroidales bacterium]|nr:D-glycero-beta-D-manno-heptose 1-phosphate adenylyltransferase [Bacteroidales bacterium]
MAVTDIEKKIIPAAAWSKPEGQKVVFTNGCFDILHRGHATYLAQARTLGDLLVVGLNTDASVQRLKGPSRPVNNQYDRAFLLASLACVDFVILFDDDTPEQLIHTVRPDVLVKGGDYTLDTIVGADFVLQNGGTVTTIPFVDGYSTTSTLNKITQPL